MSARPVVVPPVPVRMLNIHAPAGFDRRIGLG
jgi:hypothetical protein